ncbi:MAG TPA: GNAT family N-acetyltransferase [Candidatus Dojkabacteria bacterium]|nr:GNAT family N-acetyltransferase [Candidatus Dojkabacteria bacterium]
MEIEIKEYKDHDALIDFFVSRGVEFADSRQCPHPPVLSYVATIKDTLVGAITICKSNKNFILDKVAVVEEKEGQGIGTLLVKKAIEHIQEQYGKKKIYLVAHNPVFFERLGFKIIPREEAPSFSECLTCEHFQKTCFPEIMVLDLDKRK